MAQAKTELAPTPSDYSKDMDILFKKGLFTTKNQFHFRTSQENLKVKTTLDSASSGYKGKIDVQDNIKGTKVTLKANTDSQFSVSARLLGNNHTSGIVEGGFTNDNRPHERHVKVSGQKLSELYAVQFSFDNVNNAQDDFNTTLYTAAVGVGTDGFNVGAEITGDCAQPGDKSKLDVLACASYVRNDISVLLQSKSTKARYTATGAKPKDDEKNKDEYSLAFKQKLNQSLTFGVKMTYDATESEEKKEETGSRTKLTLAGKYVLDDYTTLKGKLDSHGDCELAVQQRFSNPAGVRACLSAQFSAEKMEKYGFNVQFGD